MDRDESMKGGHLLH